MIHAHCGEPVTHLSANPVYFRVKCMKCGKVFKQRKRQPKRKEAKV